MRLALRELGRTRSKAVKGLRRIQRLQGEAVEALEELNQLNDLIRETKASLTDLRNADTTSVE